MKTDGFVTFRHRSVIACFDESLLAQMVDFSISTLSIALFYQFIRAAIFPDPELARLGKEEGLTKVVDERSSKTEFVKPFSSANGWPSSKQIRATS